jgi:hypothetical protein
MVLLDIGLKEISSLSNADTPSVTGSAVYEKYFQTKIIFDMGKEIGNVFIWEAHICDVFRKCPCKAVEVGSNKG